MPIDISADALDQAVARLSSSYPGLEVALLVGDFTTELELPIAGRDPPKVGFFPGSTVGNFTAVQAVQFLRSVRRLSGTVRFPAVL